MDKETLKDRIQEQEDARRAKMIQAPRDPNRDLLPHETDKTRQSHGTSSYNAPSTRLDGEDRGFSVIMNTKSPTKPFEKGRTGASTSSGGQRTSRSTSEMRFPLSGSGGSRSSAFDEDMNSDNYQKLYERRQRELAAQKQEEAARERKQREAQGKKKADQETALRLRARQLFDEIQFWRGQYAMGLHDPTYINAMIATLQTEMNGIDPRYWP